MRFADEGEPVGIEMGKISADFEQQIERIHQLIEEDGSVVTWNDHITDPDNPKQLRQIDITVKRGDRTVHIECRLHREPQDVQWIEELHGRKDSLGADEIIAVSSSGFTSTARLKAARFRIPLRSLHEMTDDEVLLWTRATVAKAIFYQFTNNIVVFTLGIPSLPDQISITKDDGSPVDWRAMFDLVMKHFDSDQELDEITKEFNVDFPEHGVVVNGTKPSKIVLNASVRRITRELSLDTILSYNAAETTHDTQQIAYIERQGDGFVEVIKARDSDEVALVSNASLLDVPEDCFFHSLQMDFGGDVVSMKWIKIPEPNMALRSNVKIKFRFEGVGSKSY